MKTRNKLLAGAAGAAAAAAGYYFFATKDSAKHRKVAAKWATDLKKDVMKQAKTVRSLDRKSMMGIVDGVAKAYKGVTNLDQKDILKAAAELKDNWQKLRDELKNTGNLARKEAQKTIRDNSHAVKKTAKKVTSKVRKAISRK